MPEGSRRDNEEEGAEGEEDGGREEKGKEASATGPDGEGRRRGGGASGESTPGWLPSPERMGQRWLTSHHVGLSFAPAGSSGSGSGSRVGNGTSAADARRLTRGRRGASDVRTPRIVRPFDGLFGPRKNRRADRRPHSRRTDRGPRAEERGAPGRRPFGFRPQPVRGSAFR
jgi:hypothetical protein